MEVGKVHASDILIELAERLRRGEPIHARDIVQLHEICAAFAKQLGYVSEGDHEILLDALAEAKEEQKGGL